MGEMRIGFITWEPNYGDPKFTGAAQLPAPGSYTIQTIGGPRSVERIQEEIAALEKHLGWLKSELSGHSDYCKAPATQDRRWPSRYFGWDLAAGPDKTVWHCSECGIGTAPCKHAQDREGEHQ